MEAVWGSYLGPKAPNKGTVSKVGLILVSSSLIRSMNSSSKSSILVISPVNGSFSLDFSSLSGILLCMSGYLRIFCKCGGIVCIFGGNVIEMLNSS